MKIPEGFSDLYAENASKAAVFNRPEFVIQVLSAVKSDDFTDQQNKRIIKCIEELHEEMNTRYILFDDSRTKARPMPERK